MDLVFFKNLFTVIGSIIGIFAVIVTIGVWMIKTSFKKGEAYQLFKNLVEKVESISNTMNKDFIKNNREHEKFEEGLKDHDTRITTLEVIKNVEK